MPFYSEIHYMAKVKHVLDAVLCCFALLIKNENVPLTASFLSWMKNCLHLKDIFTIFNLK